MANKLTYEAILQELSHTNKLTYKSTESLLLKLNKVIDSLGIARMELLESSLTDPSQDTNEQELRSQQQHLIHIRDHLYRTLRSLQEMPRKHSQGAKMFSNDGIAKEYPTDTGVVGTWVI